ncbi:hypothetical protein [Methylovulum miyakonense]|uniref:hypothetical protein n=1 Tax=Methylovulum miyakonense TaxID=645578 RepID=UPI00039BE51A|nr:hypothetical protein [Methylovulum miyakonense]
MPGRHESEGGPITASSLRSSVLSGPLDGALRYRSIQAGQPVFISPHQKPFDTTP